MPKKVALTPDGREVPPPSPQRTTRRPTFEEIKKSMQAQIHGQATEVVKAGDALKQLKSGGANKETQGKEEPAADSAVAAAAKSDSTPSPKKTSPGKAQTSAVTFRGMRKQPAPDGLLHQPTQSQLEEIDFGDHPPAKRVKLDTPQETSTSGKAKPAASIETAATLQNIGVDAASEVIDEATETPKQTKTRSKTRSNTRSWDSRFQDLLEFKSQRGHANVPAHYKENLSLAHWVRAQRTKYKYLCDGYTNTLSAEQIDRMNEIGFVWNLKLPTQPIHNPARERELGKQKTEITFGRVLVKKTEDEEGKNPNERGTLGSEGEQPENVCPEVEMTATGETVAAAHTNISPAIPPGHHLHVAPPQEKLDVTPAVSNAVGGKATTMKETPVQGNPDTATEAESSSTPTIALALNQFKNKRDLTEADLLKAVMKEVDRGGGKCVKPKHKPKDKKVYDKKPSRQEIAQKFWDRRFEELVEYKTKYGDVNVPDQWKENRTLANFVTDQRGQYQKLVKGKTCMANGKRINLTEERIRRLNGIGFAWKRAKKYVNDPSASIEDERQVLATLEKIKGEQKVIEKAKEEGKMPSKGEFEIESKEKQWEERKIRMHEEQWNEMYEALKSYKERNGDCNVPQSEGLLGYWVFRQRQDRRRSRLVNRWVQKLDEIGFDWNPMTSQWVGMYEQLKAWKEKTGHCNVPDKTGPLGKWVSLQRSKFHGKEGNPNNNKELSEEQIRLLDNLGFVWDPYKKKWSERYQKLKKYYEQTGNCNVISGDTRLAEWVRRQRERYKNTYPSMPQEQIDLLEEIGFLWTSSEAKSPTSSPWWMRMYQAFQEHIKENGGPIDPKICTENFDLIRWINTARTKFKSNQLSQKRIGLLKEVDFDFDGPSLEVPPPPQDYYDRQKKQKKKSVSKQPQRSPHELLKECQVAMTKCRSENTALRAEKRRLCKNYANLLETNSRQSAAIKRQADEIKRLKKALRIMAQNA